MLLHDGQGNFLRVATVPRWPIRGLTRHSILTSPIREGRSGNRRASRACIPTCPFRCLRPGQNYDFTAAYNAGGSLVLDGGGTSYAGGATVGPGHEIVDPGGRPRARVFIRPTRTTRWTCAAAHIGDNDVYSAVVRDILTGYALGFDRTAQRLTRSRARPSRTRRAATGGRQRKPSVIFSPTRRITMNTPPIVQTISSAYG